MTRTINMCRVDVSRDEVDAGTNITLKCEVSCSPVRDLRGKTLLIKDQDGAMVANVELTEFNGEVNQTCRFIVAAPAKPGAYTWLAVCPEDATADDSLTEMSMAVSFTVNPHSTRVVVWDVPSGVECGTTFSVKIGMKCSAGCPPDGWAIEILDHDRKKLLTATPGDDVWPDTAALYYAEVDLRAPEIEGLYRWEAWAPADGLEIPHGKGVTGFSVRVVPMPECVLIVEAIDEESQTPVEGAKVVVHPYRAFTDERGMAKLRVPKGEYKLFVSGRNHFPFQRTGKVKKDMTIRAELAVDVGLSDADVWS